ncbi:hypothetical protein K9L16_01820 [Candidatus Pacearchaeota archaeon]|nr:hypothetical protein [Candidatus Pacearchaeota archaeon]
MGLKFCPKCKIPLIPLNKEENFLVCSLCGYKINFENLISKEKISNIEKGEGVASEENKFATYEHVCKRCGHDKVQVIDLGVSYSDEDTLYFFKCGKCGWSERSTKKAS